MVNYLNTLIITSIVLRFSQLFIDYNYDHPDQYWQGPEVAYKIHYGYGYLTWQWIMQKPIRSPLYQLYLSLGYILCDGVGCSDYLKQIAPKLMQMLISVACDVYLIKTANYYVKNIPFWIYLVILTNWYYFSSLNRTYLNSAETCLTIISFYLWLTRHQNRFNDIISRILVTISFSIRPTSIILWAIVWPYELFTKKSGHFLFILKNIVNLFFICAFSILVGTLWYGQFVWTEFNFFKYNIIYKFSELYGTQDFYYYFFTSIPRLMGGYLIPFLLSIYFNLDYFRTKKLKSSQQKQSKETPQSLIQIEEGKKYWQLFTIIILIMSVLSLLVHKQQRFLIVVTPFLLILSIKGFKKLLQFKLLIVIIILGNIFLFTTFTLIMKTGGTQILRDLRYQIDKYPASQHKNLNVLYLCEPHNLPLMSIIQRPINFKIIDSSPFSKFKKFDQSIQLVNNPYQIYNKLQQERDPQFIIIQQIFAMKGVHLNQKYQFLLQKGYSMISVRRNIFFYIFVGDGKWDGFVLLKKK